ncbi:autotransporter domain-containing protein [Parvularcula sp. LCG005]|uniref:autotransporter family protein n=1 Tax=Parvularcula sp. LCG005 TaxID=3078805 RepID=UPI00294305EE|nr:autotransporter domain-containing protein [Parvularcula sp. LCG005]WOI53053.1 autotransporter domain-containing protein [Parvularcula sp. LCG005]
MSDKLTVQRLKSTLLTGAAVCGVLAAGASAQTTVDTDRSTPIVTSTTGDTTIGTNATVTVANGTGVTIDSDNEVTTNGVIEMGNVDDATAVLITNNADFTYTQAGDIEMVDERENTTETPLDFADDRYGLRVAAGTYTGDIVFSSGSTIDLFGDNSAGIWVEGDLTGNIGFNGAMVTRGMETDAISISGDLTGDLLVGPSAQISAYGTNADAIRVDGVVDGQIRVIGAVGVTAYTDATPDSASTTYASGDGNETNDQQRARQTGHALAIRNDVTGGILVDGALPSVFSSDTEASRNAEIVVQGSGSAVSIDGGTAGITIGAYDTSDVVEDVAEGETGLGLSYGTYGLINRGTMTVNGTYQTVTATGVSIANATIDGGIRNDGSIITEARGASARAVLLRDGATTPVFYNGGRISAGTAGGAAQAGDVAAMQGGMAAGLMIKAGASVGSIVNTNRIEGVTVSDTENAYGILDESGSVTSFRNSGVVTALVTDWSDGDDSTDADVPTPTGSGIALDFSANTTGITVFNTVSDTFNSSTQSRSAFGSIGGDVYLGSGNDIYRANAGLTQGDVYLGAGNDRVELSQQASIAGDVLFGTGDDAMTADRALVVGNLDFGTGANTLSLTNGTNFSGNLLNAGTLDVTVDQSTMVLGSATNVDLGTLSITGSGDNASTLGITVSADPSGADLPPLVSRLNADTINIADGTELLTIFKGAFSAPDVEAVIMSAANLNVDLDSLILNTEGVTPFLFDQSIVIDPSDSNNVLLTLNRKSADEVGIAKNMQGAYEPIIQVLTGDEALGSALFNATTQDEFLSAFNQVVAGPLDGPMAYARAQNNSVTSIISHRVDLLRQEEALKRTIWLQEETYYVNRDSTADSNGFDGGGFVIAAGMDSPVGALDVVGASIHMASARYDEQLGEDFPFNRLTYGVDVYAAEEFGPLQFDVRAGYAAAKSESERNVDFGEVRRNLTGEWDGTQLTANGRLRYKTSLSGFDVIPFVSADYVRLEEDQYTEEGDDVIALTVLDREAQSLRANVGLSIGKTFELRPSAYETGIPGQLTPRFTAALSQELMDDPISAGYRFGEGDEFFLTSDPESSAAVLGADIDYQNQYAKVHAGVSAMVGDTTDIYTLRVGVGLKW